MNNTIELPQEKQESINSIPVESLKEFNVVQIKKFQEILGILNRYHNVFSKEKSVTQINREKVEKENPENIILKVRKFGNNEYVIDAEIKGVVRDTWIHIDGIAEERKLIKDPSHPIFKIECLEDIYNM